MFAERVCSVLQLFHFCIFQRTDSRRGNLHNDLRSKEVQALSVATGVAGEAADAMATSFGRDFSARLVARLGLLVTDAVLMTARQSLAFRAANLDHSHSHTALTFATHRATFPSGA